MSARELGCWTLREQFSQLGDDGRETVDGHTEGYQETQATMEERQGHTQYRLKCLLHPPYPGAWGVGKLLEEVILSKGEDRHKRDPGGAETDTHKADGA